jgi:hypothetical protein
MASFLLYRKTGRLARRFPVKTVKKTERNLIFYQKTVDKMQLLYYNNFVLQVLSMRNSMKKHVVLNFLSSNPAKHQAKLRKKVFNYEKRVLEEGH